MDRQYHPFPPILITRPAAQAERFARDLARRFGPHLKLTLSPLLVPQFLAPALPSGAFTSVIFTSETAIEAFSRISPAAFTSHAWCVGNRTAFVARKAGYRATATDADASALSEAILTSGEAGPLLYPHGSETRGDLAPTLSRSGFSITELVVYEQVPQPLSAEAEALLSSSEPILAPVFSPRTGSLLMAERQRLNLPAPLLFAALSSAVADTLILRQQDRIAISEKPEQEAMFRVMLALADRTA